MNFHNDGRWYRDQQGVWHHPVQGAWFQAHDGLWYRASPQAQPSGGRWVIWLVGLGVLYGGCSFIISDPVTALAIFFVGIPFVLFVGWLMMALLSQKR